MVALPAARDPRHADAPMPGASPNQSGQITPPPVSATPPPQPMAPAPAPGRRPRPSRPRAATFRETLWFKKGDVDQMVAEARARVEAARARASPVAGRGRRGRGGGRRRSAPEERAKPLEERYVDDGSVTAEDRKKFSLRSGATSTALPTVGGAMPGERMSDAEVMGEMRRQEEVHRSSPSPLVVAALLGIFVFKKHDREGRLEERRRDDAADDPDADRRRPRRLLAAAPRAAPSPPPAGQAAAAKDNGDEPAPKAAHAPRRRSTSSPRRPRARRPTSSGRGAVGFASGLEQRVDGRGDVRAVTSSIAGARRR